MTNYYLASSSSTGVTTSIAGWTTSPQTITNAKRYHWNYRVELYTDGTSKTTTPAIIGVYGDKGDTGARGIPGAKGADGRTQYTHIAYADNATGGGFSQTDQTKAYIGMYQDFNATDSNNPTAYRWTKWRGSDGAQGIPGKAGADGRTPYFHRAWANSANGRDGFSTSDSTNKRYLGTLTDFTEADSQDPTRYKWTALFNTTEQGGNILLNSGEGWRNLHQKEFILAENIVKGKQYTLTARWWRSDSSTLNFGIRESSSDSFQWVNLRYSSDLDVWTANFTSKKTVSAGSVVYFFTVEPNGIGNADWAVLTVGAVPLSSWQPHWSETQKQIDDKADNVLTQEQLNALNERAGLIQAEMEAKAAMDTVTKWFAEYQQFVEDQKAGMQRSNNDIVTLSQRVNAIDTNLGNMAQRWSFIDSYMKAGNEGLVIGKNDGSSSVRISDNRISFYSAGQEVAYISNGVLQIDNGVFTKTLQIGRFREEQYHSNLDMNVMRYVGG